MALSNMFREPRREITETAVGIVIAAVIIYLFHFLVQWVYDPDPHAGFPHINNWSVASIISVFIVVVFLMATIGGAMLIHLLGEKACDWLQEKGIHLRPRQRY